MAERHSSSPRIFYAEDDDSIREPTAELFRYAGLEVVLCASSVAQALSYIPDQMLDVDPQVAVLDRNMPDGTGEEIATALAESGILIPIIAYSNSYNWLGWADTNVMKPYYQHVVTQVQRFAADPLLVYEMRRMNGLQQGSIEVDHAPLPDSSPPQAQPRQRHRLFGRRS